MPPTFFPVLHEYHRGIRRFMSVETVLITGASSVQPGPGMTIY
jgi:hypothetical protein